MDDKKTLMEALVTGRELELEGIKFYSEAAKGLEDEKGRWILELLAREEEGHLNFIVGLEAAAVAAGMIPGREEEEHPRFVEWLAGALRTGGLKPPEEPKRLKKPGLSPGEMRDSPLRKDLAVLKEARRAELRSIEFYEKCLAEVGKPECTAIEELIAAEKRHLKWVEFMQDYVMTHGCWYEVKK